MSLVVASFEANGNRYRIVEEGSEGKKLKIDIGCKGAPDWVDSDAYEAPVIIAAFKVGYSKGRYDQFVS